jgi:ribosome-binding factor A
MSRRTEQVAELLRQEINKVIVKDFEPPAGMLVSVTEVTVAPNLKNATAFLSVIPTNKLGTGLEAIKKFSGHIQKEINKHLVIKFVPKIHWQIDERDLKYKEIDQALAESN